MENIVADFLDYLTGVKNYSSHTRTAYESDVRDFLGFMNALTARHHFHRTYRVLIQYAFVHSWLIASVVVCRPNRRRVHCHHCVGFINSWQKITG